MIAARERARRLQAALGEDAPVLMGCSLGVLLTTPHQVVAANPDAAANGDPDPPASVPARGAERLR